VRGCLYKYLRGNGNTRDHAFRLRRLLCRTRETDADPCVHARIEHVNTAVFVIGINPAPAIQTGQRESLDFSSIFIFLANSVATRGEKNMTRSCAREPYRGSNGENGGTQGDEIKKRIEGGCECAMAFNGNSTPLRTNGAANIWSQSMF